MHHNSTSCILNYSTHIGLVAFALILLKLTAHERAIVAAISCIDSQPAAFLLSLSFAFGWCSSCTAALAFFCSHHSVTRCNLLPLTCTKSTFMHTPGKRWKSHRISVSVKNCLLRKKPSAVIGRQTSRVCRMCFAFGIHWL